MSPSFRSVGRVKNIFIIVWGKNWHHKTQFLVLFIGESSYCLEDCSMYIDLTDSLNKKSEVISDKSSSIV